MVHLVFDKLSMKFIFEIYAPKNGACNYCCYHLSSSNYLNNNSLFSNHQFYVGWQFAIDAFQRVRMNKNNEKKRKRKRKDLKNPITQNLLPFGQLWPNDLTIRHLVDAKSRTTSPRCNRQNTFFQRAPINNILY